LKKIISSVLLSCVVFSNAALAEVSTVRLQIAGCLRSTCSRKVAQALKRGQVGLPSVGKLKVEDGEHGLASFTPKARQTVNIRRMYQELNRAGYGLTMVVLETDKPAQQASADVADLGGVRAELRQDCALKDFPASWKEQARGRQYVWLPGDADETADQNTAISVCAVN
jgi:hypothetical protein